MNYFAHGHSYIDQPYFLAGTAVPDWLGGVDRRVRVRSKIALKFINDADFCLARVAQGIVRHLRDDEWFHGTPTFAQLSCEFTARAREAMPDDGGLRPRFLGHILVEILLDAALIRDEPTRLDDYYRALNRVDPEVVCAAVNRMTTRSADQLGSMIRRFSAERFLYDYLDDAKLLLRLNQIMCRVGLVPLPGSICDMFPEARRAVIRGKDQLLATQTNPLNNGNGDDSRGDRT